MKNDVKIVMSIAEMEAAWRRRDASYDGIFYFGVKTTGIFCRPSCPSQPNRSNLEFFPNVASAVGAGYRACKRCQPELASGAAPEWAAALMRDLQEQPEKRFSRAQLQARGLTVEKVRRWFKGQYGMTFAAWSRAMRLSGAFQAMREGATIDDAVFQSGFESHSGFRDAFSRIFKVPPGRASSGNCIFTTFVSTPVGPMIAGATKDALVLLEFADQRGFVKSLESLAEKLGGTVLPGENEITERTRTEVAEYFEGKRREFSIPFRLAGSAFQEAVWRSVRNVPPGETSTYADIAKAVEQPGAVRAVGRANGLNRLYLIVPCHRIIATNGSLSGYGGGVWRKRILLEMEKRAAVQKAAAA